MPSFFTGPERVFDPFLFGDVENGAGHTDGVSDRIPIHVAPGMDGSDVTVWTDDAIFDIIGHLSRQRVVDCRQDAVMIVGEQRSQERVIRDVDRAGLVAEDPV